MKRLHVHVSVDDLDQAVHFYSGLFGAAATVRKDDYAKWRLDDPCVNFAITARGKPAGIQHLGVDIEDEDEFSEVRERLAALDGRQHDQRQTTCCYTVSDKSWLRDPAGVVWELFRTLGSSATFGDRGPQLRDQAGQDPERPDQGSGPCCGG